MTDTYKTITTKSEGIYKEKGSKFLSFAIPVSSAAEAKNILNFYKKEYYDARHVCYAYMLGADRKEFRANDDGEPSGTAGRPILGQINSRELTNVLVIVVRYFGGILLGTGGLVVAYKEATINALERSEIIEKLVEETISIQFEYTLLNEVLRIVKDTNAQICNQIFADKCAMQLSIRRNEASILTSKLSKIYGLIIDDESETSNQDE